MLRTPERLQHEFGIAPELGQERALPRFLIGYAGKCPSVVSNDGEIRANPERFNFFLTQGVLIMANALPEEGQKISSTEAVRQDDLAAMCAVRRPTMTRRIDQYAALVESPLRKHAYEPVELLKRERQFAMPNVYSWNDQPARSTEWWAVLEYASDDGEDVYTEVLKRGFLSEDTCRKWCEENSANAKPNAKLVAQQMSIASDEVYRAPSLAQLVADRQFGALWDDELLKPGKKKPKTGGFKDVPKFIWDTRICVQDWILKDDLGQVHGRWSLRRVAHAYFEKLKAEDPETAARLTLCQAPEDWVVEERTRVPKDRIGGGIVELGRWQSETEAWEYVNRARERKDYRVSSMHVCRRARRLSETARLVMTYYFMCGILDPDKKTGRPKGILDRRDGNGGPYRETIARACGISEKSVYDANCELESIGLIRVAHPEPRRVSVNGKEEYRRGACIIVYLPLRQVTHEEALAERERLTRELKCCAPEIAAVIAPIHQQLLDEWQRKVLEGRDAMMNSFFVEFERRMLEAGVRRSVARSLVPQPAAPQ